MNRPTSHRIHRPGAVMVITLLAIVLLVALILFVLNLGQQVNRRIATQDTADATAIAGATWIARTLNTVAHNNINTARYISLVTVLDAMPQSVEFTLIEQTAIREALEQQLQRGVTSSPASMQSLLRDLLQEYEQELADEITQLQTVDGLLDSFDIRSLTYYQSADGPGALWRAMFAMDEMSQSMMEQIGPLSQRLAVDGGEVEADQEDAAQFIVPLNPSVPHERGAFNDFEQPVRSGVLPPAIDDTTERRGPFDAVFGWRDLVTHRTGATWVPGSSHNNGGGSGNVPIGRGAGGGSGQWEGGELEVTAYDTWGTHTHHLRRVSDFVTAHLRNTRLQSWVSSLSRAKLNYLWPSGAADPDDPLAQTVRPQYIIDYNQARAEARARPQTIRNTVFIAVEIKSRYPLGHGQFLSDGSWALIEEDDIQQPRVVRTGGWTDPQSWEASPSVTKVVDHGWRDQWQYEAWYDLDIGLDPLVDDNGQPVSQPVYRIDHFYFVGINVGDEEDIGDPFEGFDPNSSDAPAPMNLDHRAVTRDPSARRLYLACLAVARQGDRAQAWPSRFAGNKPFANTVGLAQARVFNNHSWDLWTPMWHASLEPIDQYELWLDQLAADRGASALVQGVNSDELAELQAYLNAVSNLAEPFAEH